MIVIVRRVVSLVIIALAFSPRPTHGQLAPPPNLAARAADSVFRAGDYASALTAYEALVREAPGNSAWWGRLGFSAASLKNYRRGLEAFERAVAIDSNPTAMYNVGAMSARLGRTDSAVAWLDRAVTRGFRALSVLENDDDYSAARSHPKYAGVMTRLETLITPCASSENARKFDFWIGDWDVRTVQGQLAGHNVIERVSGDCALLENWTDAGGRTGKSLNAFNQTVGQWQQFWVGQSGEVTEYRESTWEGKSLVFVNRGSGTVLRRLTFTPITADHVRQHGEISQDGGVTWTTQYDLQYHRKK